jgi:hypothetical protein
MSLDTCIHVNCVVDWQRCVEFVCYWIMIGINYFGPLGVKIGIIYLINGRLKGVKVV